MIEGQEDVSWEQWVALARACERGGIEALFRSDHYMSVAGRRGRGSLDAWATIIGLAAETSKLRLGTLVSPASFRHPSVLAKTVVTADHVSGGRVELGLGAGWLEAEHAAYGFPFLPTRERMDVLEEQLQVIRGEWGPGPFSFEGRHYRIEHLDALPKPLQLPGPPIVIGGSGGPRSIALAARYADEYNTIFATPDRCRELRAKLDERLPLSVMTGVVIGSDRADFESRAARLAEWAGSHELPPPWLTGTVDDVRGRLAELEEAGVERVMLQHLLHWDLDAVELIASL
jgi:F420-dependent oxidoreductase-like protein